MKKIKIKKLDRLETHDRYKEFTKDQFGISEECQKIIDKRPFGSYPFYIFAHSRTIDEVERFQYFLNTGLNWEKIPSKRIIWQPRLTKPDPQENSMCFRVSPGSDNVEIVWVIPDKNMWDQYEKGKITENNIIKESIDKFKNRINDLKAPHNQDLSDERAREVYKHIYKSGTVRRDFSN